MLNISPLSRFLILTAGTAVSFYGFCQYIAYETRLDYNKTIEKKDTTRQQYGSFGMDWGYKADDIILSQIDSGDIIMFHMECKSFTPGEILQCYKDTFFQYRQIKKDNIAMAYRDKEGVKLLVNMFNKTKVIEYPELLAHPGLHYLAIKKVQNFSLQDHKKLGQIVESKQSKIKDQKSYNFFNEIFSQLGYLSTPLLKLENEFDISDNITKKFGSSINVRTERSKQN